MIDIVIKNELGNIEINEWLDLWRKLETATFFNSYLWYMSCKNGLNQNINIWYVYDSQILVGIVLLCKERRFGIPCYRIIGQPYTDKCSILLDESYRQMLPQILSIAGNGLPVIIDEVPISCHYNDEHIFLEDEASINPYIDLTEDIYYQVKRKEWNSIKRKSERCPYTFKIFCGKDAHEHINILWEIENSSNKLSKHRAMFDMEQTRTLFQLASAGEDAILAVLYDDEKPIAHMYGYNIKKRVFHAHHMAYLQEYFKDTPGKIVIYKLLKYLKENEFQIFDFSRGDTMLKRHFSTYREINYSYYCNLSFFSKFWFKTNLWIKRKYKVIRHHIKIWYVTLKAVQNE